MSFSSKKKSWLPHLVSVLVSVVMATAMWYMVSVRDRIEAQFEVNIDYIGIPKNLIVTDGLINRLTIRLRGPETLLRALNSQRLNQQIDLSQIKKGVTIVPLTTERLAGYYRAFELVDVQPPRIVVKADEAAEREVPVVPVISSPLRSGALSVEDVVVDPPTVTLWGPEGILADMNKLRLPIELDPRSAGGTVSDSYPLDSPGLVSVTPKSVRVTYSVTSRHTTLERTCRVAVASDNPGRYSVEPSELKLRVEIPEALARSSSYLSSLKVEVIPPGELEPGERAEARLLFSVPDGMPLLSPHPEAVMVTSKRPK